jgi:exodeoxyribonuclease VII small subunit
VAELEGREINLETDIPKFERGMKLAQELAAHLKKAENVVEKINLKYGGSEAI